MISNQSLPQAIMVHGIGSLAKWSWIIGMDNSASTVNCQQILSLRSLKLGMIYHTVSLKVEADVRTEDIPVGFRM